MDSPGATSGAWLMLGCPGVGRGYNLGQKVPERDGNVRGNQRDSPCNVRSGGDHGIKPPRNAALLHAVLAAVALAEYNDRWQEGIRTWSGRAVPSWAPVWHSCAAEAARQCGKGSGQKPHNAIARHAVPSPGVVDFQVCRQPPPIHVASEG